MIDREKQIDKINKLLQLGEKNANPAERRAARAKAYQMMLDYDIADEEISWPQRHHDEERERVEKEEARRQAEAFQAEQERIRRQAEENARRAQEEAAQYAYQNSQNVYQNQTAAATAVNNRIKEPPKFLYTAIGFLIIFGILAMIWPWSMKSLIMTAGAVLVLANIRYIVLLVFLYALGAFFESMIR